MKTETQREIEKGKELVAKLKPTFRGDSLTKNLFENLDNIGKLFELCDYDERKLYQNLLTNNRRYEEQLKAQEAPKIVEAPQPVVSPVPSVSAPQKPAVCVPVDDPAKEMGALIPSMNGYIPRRMHGSTDEKIILKLYETRQPLLLVGETGSGKTHLARHLAHKLKLPYHRISCNGGTTPEDFVGQWIPNPVSDSPRFIWRDGWLPKFMRYGGVLVVDEINMANADILALLHSVTDDERTVALTQKDGEVIHAHKDFWLVATMNPETYEGTKKLNGALKNRMRVLYIGYDENTEKKLGIPDNVVELAKKLRESKEILSPTGTRTLLQYIADCGNISERVARELFINQYDESEQPVVREVFSLMFDKPKNAESKSDDSEEKED